MVHKVYPAVAFLDPKYLRSAPFELIVNSSVDTLAHLYESVLNSKADDYVRMTASAGLATWARIRSCLLANSFPSDDELALLLRSSTIAGMSIAQSGTSLPHALSYTLTYDLDMPHGAAVGYFLPGFLAATPENERNEVLRLSGFSGLADFRSFITDVLQKPDISKYVLDKAYDMVKNNSAKMNSASFPVDDDILYAIVYS